MKFVVLLFCVVTVKSYNRYCEICRNHTLCKYPLGGPTSACRNFDQKASMTDVDIAEIVNRINSRRNLVAVGRLKKFPQAANMRKVQWSNELAKFAQRWADQCDPSVRPNKEDECRDLVGMEVGQSIAAVVGPAPGLNVKSFVDMWFILKFHYLGSVMYYNRSRDEKTNYFTQLIWADTQYVGCGKIHFYNQEITTVVERLVCNFAPKGNNHGKPVYAMGFPATQCSKFMSPDLQFPGLCKQNHETAKEIVQESLTSSLLRILDSSNSSVKQNLDPNNLGSNSSEVNDQRNQKIRHAYLNKSNGSIKRDSLHMQNSHLNPLNDIDNLKGYQYSTERGHSRMYHGHLSKIEPMKNFQTESFSEQDFKKFDVSTTFNPLSLKYDHDHVSNAHRIINGQNDYLLDGRRISDNQNDRVPEGRRIITDQNNYPLDRHQNFGDHMCTRKPKCNDCFPKLRVTNQCTRGQSHSCNSCLKPQLCNSCLELPLPPVPPTPSHDSCPCKATCPPISSSVCPVCPSQNCPQSETTSFCAKRRAQNDAQDANKSTQYNYYDLFPNIRLQNGDENQRNHFDKSDMKRNLQYKAKESELNDQVKEISDALQMNLQAPQDSHDTFYSSEREKRNFEDQLTFKPFWQVDEYNYKRPSELKSLRYTTLADKRYKKSRWTTKSMRLPTESITINLNDELIHNEPQRDHITEKYLSFEELMHLRKLSTLEGLDYEFRRYENEALRAPNTANKNKSAPNKPTTNKHAPNKSTTNKPAATKSAANNPTTLKPTTKPASTTATTTKTTTGTVATMPSVTANTPFIRLKQCTRKITCTWTALMFMTGSDGNLLTGVPNGVGGILYNVEAGSRTPPGYVDGCTRTSTCTRDFMDRNKIPTQTTEDETGDFSSNGSTAEDEEYCERRLLDVQKRNLDDTDKILNIKFQRTPTEMTASTAEISHVTNRGVDSEVPQDKHSECICYDNNSRFKRDKISKYEQLAHKDCNFMIKNKVTQNQDVNDLNSMLRTVSIASKSNKTPHRCECNATKSLYNTLYWTTLSKYSFIIWIMWTYYYQSLTLGLITIM